MVGATGGLDLEFSDQHQAGVWVLHRCLPVRRSDGEGKQSETPWKTSVSQYRMCDVK